MSEQTPRRGRPRNIEADSRILSAARQVLEVYGYEALGVDRVAEMAGVAKTTLYRRWPSKAHLVIALVADLQRKVNIDGTGDIRHDLVTLVRGIAAALRVAGPALVADLVSALNRDPEAAKGIHQLFASRRRAAIKILQAAQERGEIKQDSDPEILVDQLAGPLYYRLLITGDPINAEYAANLVDSVLSTHLSAK